jgi:hypothetical protein
MLRVGEYLSEICWFEGTWLEGRWRKCVLLKELPGKGISFFSIVKELWFNLKKDIVAALFVRT